MRRRLPRTGLALALLGLAALLAGAPARASWMIPGQPWRPKDFTLVKKDGLYHLFFIRHNISLAWDSTEVDFGHAVSRDLWNWTQLDPVIPVRAGSWDRSHVWAPSIVLQDGVYYMFYTGVVDVPGVADLYQRIGVATSTDLLSWNRMDLPVYGCVDVPWSFCDSLNANTGFRDPFVMPDPAHPGSWLMYYSTYPAADSGGMIVGVARSAGDLLHWTDVGPLWITNRQYSYNSIVESPHVFAHAGLWYLFFTTNAGQPITFATGPDPVGPLGSWTYRGRLANMLGWSTTGWIASEEMADGKVDYFGFVLADRIDVRRIAWNSDWTFALQQPDFLHVSSMTWDSSAVHERSPVTLTIEAANGTNRSVDLEAVRLLAGGGEEAVPLDSLGLATPLALLGDTTRVTWLAHAPADSSGARATLRLVIRMADRTATTPELDVDPTPLPPPPDDGAPPPDPADRPRTGRTPAPAVADSDTVVVVRVVRGTPVAPGPAVLVQLDRAASCRVDLFDVQGRRVRNLADRVLPRGASVLAWDGRDESGAPAGPGIYFARLVTPRLVRSARLLLAR